MVGGPAKIVSQQLSERERCLRIPCVSSPWEVSRQDTQGPASLAHLRMCLTWAWALSLAQSRGLEHCLAPETAPPVSRTGRTRLVHRDHADPQQCADEHRLAAGPVQGLASNCCSVSTNTLAQSTLATVSRAPSPLAPTSLGITLTRRQFNLLRASLDNSKPVFTNSMSDLMQGTSTMQLSEQRHGDPPLSSDISVRMWDKMERRYQGSHEENAAVER